MAIAQTQTVAIGTLELRLGGVLADPRLVWCSYTLRDAGVRAGMLKLTPSTAISAPTSTWRNGRRCCQGF